MSLIIFMTVGIISLLILALSALLAYKRGLFRTTVKGGIAVLSLILSLILSGVIAGSLKAAFSALGDLLVKTLEGASESVSELLDASATMKGLIGVLPVAIIAPVIFVVLFFVIKIVLDIVFKAVRPSIMKNKQEPFGFNGSKWASAGVGVIIGMICIFAISLPANGYIEIGADAFAAAESALPENDTMKVVASVVDGLDGNPVKVLNYNLGGEAAFNAMTTVKIENKKYSIGKELSAIVSTASNAVSLKDEEVENWGAEQANALRAIPESFKDSELLPEIMAEFVCAATDKWSAGEKFASIALPTEGVTKEIINDAVECFKGSSSQTIKEDIGTICNVLAVITENDAVSSLLSEKGDNTSQLLKALGKEGLLNSVFNVLYQNNRMKKLIPSLTNVGIMSAASALKIPTNAEVNDKVVTKISDKITEINQLPEEERTDAAVTYMSGVLTENGISVPDEVTETFASTIVENFSGKEAVTAQDVNDYLEILSKSYDFMYTQNKTVSCSDEISFTFLSVGSASDNLFKNIDNEELTVTEAEISSMLQMLNTEFGEAVCTRIFGGTTDAVRANVKKMILINKQINTIAKTKPEATNILSLDPKKELITTTTTVETLKMKIDVEAITADDIDKLGKNLEVATTNLAIVVENISTLSSDATGADKVKAIDMTALGTAFEALQSDAVIGSTSTTLLESGLKSFAGVEIKIDEITSNKDEGVEDSKLTDVLVNLQDTVVLVDEFNDTKLTDEEKTAKVKAYIEKLNPSNSVSISKLMNTKIVETFGVPADYSEKTAVMLKEMFVQLGKTEDKDGKESAAVKHLIDVAFATKSGAGDVFGENGRIKDMNSLIDTCVKSTVASNTIKKAVTDNSTITLDPLGVSAKLSESDITDLTNALDSYKTANSSLTADQKNTLVCIAALFGISYQAA